MNNKILVTGASGNVGSEVVKSLLKKGMPVKAAVRNLAKASALFTDPAVEYALLDFENENTFSDAFANVTGLFLMRPPEMTDIPRQMYPLIRYAKKHGVEHIVFLSLMGVQYNPFVPHRKAERCIKASGIPYTFLRAAFFMQNLSTFYKEDIKYKNEIYIAAGKGRTSFIDVRDIAEVAAAAFASASHRNKAYTLTGSEALDYFKVAEILSAALHRTITYPKPSSSDFKKRLESAGFSKEFIQVMNAIYFTVRIGLGAFVTKETEKLLGRKPITLKEYAEDYRHIWS